MSNKNYLKRARYIVGVYQLYKTPEVPDTYILRVIFPKYNIYISYRQWSNIKNRVIPGKIKY